MEGNRILPWVVLAAGLGWFQCASAWQTEILDTGYGGHPPAVTLDREGHVYLLYPDLADEPDRLQCLTNASGAWVKTTILEDDDEFKYPSIAVDASGNLHVVFEWMWWPDTVIEYGTDASGSWSFETIAYGDTLNCPHCYCTAPSMALDTSGKVHVSYVKGSGDFATRSYYVTNRSGSWHTTRLEDQFFFAGLPSAPPIAVDTAGHVHLAFSGFVDNEDLFLKYATNRTGTWSFHPVTEGSYSAGGKSITVGPGDLVHISYRETNGPFMVATGAGMVWHTEAVDPSDEAGRYNCLAVDTSGRLVLAYSRSDADTHRLELATKTPLGSWERETICDRAGGSGKYCSVALGEGGRVYVAHVGDDDALLLTSGVLPAPPGWAPADLQATTLPPGSRRGSRIASILCLLLPLVGLILVRLASSFRP